MGKHTFYDEIEKCKNIFAVAKESPMHYLGNRYFGHPQCDLIDSSQDEGCPKPDLFPLEDSRCARL